MKTSPALALSLCLFATLTAERALAAQGAPPVPPGIPVIAITQPDGPEDWGDDSYTIRWVDEDTDSDAEINLYYDTDDQGFDGTLITTSPLSEDGTTDAFTWSTTGLDEGDYWIYATITDGSTTDQVYSYHPARVLHPATPGDTLAFPGAEGAGMYATGGRDGEVYVVWNTNKDGTGSLQEGLIGATGPRIIVFAVSGTINWEDTNVDVNQYAVTVAGQTAPGEGILIRGNDWGLDPGGSLILNHDDIIVQHLRCRLGAGKKGGEQFRKDALKVGHPTVSLVNDVIVDHVSISWGSDENLGMGGPAASTTIQHCIISEGLDYYDKQSDPDNHSMGARVGSEVGGFTTLHHTLWAHHRTRVPRAVGDANDPNWVDFRNNTIYNCRDLTGHGADQKTRWNYINNYLIDGQDTDDNVKGILWTHTTSKMGMYCTGNVSEGHTEQDWDAMDYEGTGESEVRKGGDSPYPMPFMRTTDAITAHAEVLANSGAILPSRDTVDARIVRALQSGTGTLIDKVSDLPAAHGYPTLYSLSSLADDDSDGMPNQWENAFGLDPNDSSDAMDDDNGDGWVNIESYIHNLNPAYHDKTIVYVRTEDSRATEYDVNPLNPGIVRFTRAGARNIHLPLTVNYNLAGSADTSDYLSLPGSVDIPAGETSVSITIQPIEDSMSESEETVVIKLAAGAYVRGCPRKGLVAIRAD